MYARALFGVVRAALMRILAVAEVDHLVKAVTRVSGNASTSPNQRAIAASYAAVVANASAARVAPGLK